MKAMESPDAILPTRPCESGSGDWVDFDLIASAVCADRPMHAWE